MADQAPTPTPEDYDNLAQALRSSDPVLKAQAHAVLAKLPPDQKNTLLSGGATFTPDTLAPPGLVTPLANAAVAPAVDATTRVISAAKAAIGGIGAPILKYEATKALLKHVGVPDNLATVGAIAVSGYTRGGSPAAKVAAAEGAETAAAPAAAADAGLVDVSPPTPAAGMGRSPFNDAMAAARGGPPVAASAPGAAAAVPSGLHLSAPEFAQATAWVKQGVPQDQAIARVLASRAMSGAMSFSGLPTPAEAAAEVAARRGSFPISSVMGR